MTRAELKSAAKEQIRGKIGILFVMTLIIFAISCACAFIPIIGALISFIIAPAFSLSLCIIYLKLTKNEDIAVGNLFDGFNRTGRALWLYILSGVFTFLWSCQEIMNGHKFDLFILGLSFIGWYFLVGITFGIASIYVLPYMSATTANFYNSIKEA